MKIKKILFYLLVFVITLLILLTLLVITAKIPREMITENLRKTTETLKINNNHVEVKEVIKNERYIVTHVYADIMLLNIIYSIDTNNPLPSVMEANYYSKGNSKEILYDFNEIIDENYQANTQYMRYWHGSMSIIRPLLVFFDISQIYIVNAVMLAISSIVLLILLIKTKIKELVIAYIMALVMCSVGIVPFCLEYYWTFLIMTIISIIAIRWDKEGKKLNALFLITGMLTCYLDFLSTEIITGLIPVLFLLVIRYKQDRLCNMKEGLQFLVVSMLFWTIGYIGMWLAKWILASIILQVNAWEYVKTDMQFRINGRGYEQIAKRIADTPNLSKEAIMMNVKLIFPYRILKRLELVKATIICTIVMELMLIRKKEMKKLWFSGLLLMIAIIPYIRYAVLASHSYTHFFFTFRSQIITIMAVFLAIIYSIDKNEIKKEVKIRRKKCI